MQHTICLMTDAIKRNGSFLGPSLVHMTEVVTVATPASPYANKCVCVGGGCHLELREEQGGEEEEEKEEEEEDDDCLFVWLVGWFRTVLFRH